MNTLIEILDNGCKDCNHREYIMIEDNNNKEEYCMGCGALIFTLNLNVNNQ